MKTSDQRVRLTKMLLRRALTELLKQKPVQSISVKELCEKAGIHRGTFYAHYTDIFDLLAQVEEEMMQDFRAALVPLLAAEKGDLTARKITVGIFRCLKENADICTVMLGPYGDKTFAMKLIELGRTSCVENYRRFFEGATHRQLEFFYAFVSAGCIGLLQTWLEEGMVTPAEEMADMAGGMIMHGIGFLQTDKKSG